MRKKPESQSEALPASIEAERSVLGAILLDNAAFHHTTVARITSDHFYLDAHRKIFRAMQLLVAEHKPVEFVTLGEELKRNKELESVGDLAYISDLLDGVPDRSDGIHFHCEILRERHMRRVVIRKSNACIASAMDPSDPIKWTVAGINQDLLRLQGDADVKSGMMVREFSSEVMAEITTLMDRQDNVIGLPFGIPELDEVTTGLRGGEFVPIGGFPGSGKTAFGLNVARLNAKKVPVAFFSIEMPKKDLLLRVFSQESGIAYSKLRNPFHLHGSERRELEAWKTNSIDKLQLVVDDDAKHIDEIVPRAHLYIQQHKVKLIVVDFLQIIDASGEHEPERVGNASDALTHLAKTTGVPVLALSQLTPKGDEKRNPANIIPTLNMLRMSGKIGQNAHLVLFTYHPEDENGEPTGDDMIVIGKQRAGIKGRVKCYFDGKTQTWSERGEATAPPQKEIFK